MKTINPDELDRIRNLDDGFLLAEIKARIAQTTDDFLWLAVAVQEGTRRNSDVAEYAKDIVKCGFWIYLPSVANGTVLPSVVATYQAREDILPLVAQLTLDEQERLSRGDFYFEVEEKNPRYGQQGQPEFDTRKVFPAYLPTGLIPQIFNTQVSPKGTIVRVRDKAEQRAFILNNAAKSKPSHKVRVPTLRVDAEHMLVYVDGKPVRASALADAIAQLATDRPEVEAMFKKAFREVKAHAHA